jgi:hypothetical protein
VSSDWVVLYFDQRRDRESESKKLPSLAEAIGVAEGYESRGLVVRLILSPHAKLHWPIRRRELGD